MPSTTDCLMGASDAELERLTLQAALLAPVTRRLIQQAGIGPGMRVLDTGCGVGDVSLLLAEAVGPSGQVVAIDREERMIVRARSRPRPPGGGGIEFVATADEDFRPPSPFDAAVGRCVLIHQADPAATVRPGGVVAFEETVFSAEASAIPPLDLWTRLLKPAYAAARAGMPSPDAGGRLVPIFEDAGLPAPNVFWQSVVGGPESSIVRWMVMNYRNILPVIGRLGLAPADVGDLDTLEDRLVAAARAERTQFVAMTEACAWAVRP